MSELPVVSERPQVPKAILLAAFLGVLGFTLVMPYLADESRSAFGTSALVGTLLSSAFALPQFLFLPFWGRLSDRVGRRPVLVALIAADSAGMAGLGVAIAYGDSIGWLFAARIFSGIAAASSGVTTAYVADVTTAEGRGRGMGMIAMAAGLGFIVGPGLGGILGQLSLNGRHGAIACFASAGLGIVNLALATFYLHESLPPEARTLTHSKPRGLGPLDMEAVRQAFSQTGIPFGILVGFLLGIALAIIDQTFRYFNKDVFRMTESQTGLVFLLIGIGMIFTQGAIVQRFARTMDETTLIRIGLVFAALGFAGFSVAPTLGLWALYASASVLSVGLGCAQPGIQTYLSKRAAASTQGATFGTSEAAASIANVLGPPLGGFAYGAIDPRAPYVAASLMGVIGLLIAARLKPQLIVP